VAQSKHREIPCFLLAEQIMKRCLIRIVIGMIFSIPMLASSEAGFEFLKTNFGARAAAMGGAFISEGDLIAINYNPAGLYGLEQKKVVFSYLDYFVDFQGGVIEFGYPLSDHRILAGSLAYMSYGNIDETDVTGTKTGSFTPMDFSLGISYAASASYGIRYGISGKYIRSQIQQFMSDAICLDAGLMVRIEKQMMNIGLTIHNLGQTLTAYRDEKEKLPLVYQAGVSKSLAHLPLTLHFCLQRYHFQESELFGGLYWSLGGEFKLSQSTFLRWGYHSVGQEQKAESDKDRFTGISAGFGTQINRFMIDYAISLHGVLGNTNQFTVQMML
jgi:hypothetical protein